MTGSDVARAEQLVELGRYAEARTALDAAIATEPDSGRLHALMAQAMLGLEDPAGALVHANQVVALEPDSEWGHRLASIALVRLRLAEESVRAAAEAVRLAPLNWRSHQVLALAASDLPARRSQAAAAADHAAALAPGEAGAHFAVGLVAQRVGDRKRAAAAYERTLGLQPDHAEALNNLTVVRDHRHLRRAARGYGGSLRADPQNPVTQRNIELLAVRMSRRVYFGSLVALLLGVVVSGASRGQLGPANLAVAGLTVAAAAAYAVTVRRAVPAGMRRFLWGRVTHDAFLLSSSVLALVMLVLAVVTNLVPYGAAVGLAVIYPLGAVNVALAIWSRRRRAAR